MSLRAKYISQRKELGRGDTPLFLFALLEGARETEERE